MTDESEPRWGPDQGQGRMGLFWIGIWMVFLFIPIQAGWQHRDSFAGWAGIVLTIAFGVWYLGGFIYQRRHGFATQTFHLPARKVSILIGVAFALAILDCVALGQPANATAVYLCVLLVMALRPPLSLLLAAANAAAWYAAGWVIPGWKPDIGLLLSMLTASAAVFGIQQMILGNIALRRANDENQRLAVSDERNRFARDLHDILGHSLTVITVKAELAQRLFDVDPERARIEIKDLERLSRDALADVRRAVGGYRELTLPGELAQARAALNAAQIDAELPNTTDAVPGDLRELFAWTLREGVTNVIRHSGATTCRVRLTGSSIEIEDDGRGPGEGPLGNGLNGLRERAASLGATVVTRSAEPHGFSLMVVAT